MLALGWFGEEQWSTSYVSIGLRKRWLREPTTIIAESLSHQQGKISRLAAESSRTPHYYVIQSYTST